MGKVELAHSSSQVTLEIKDRFGKTTQVPLGAHPKGEVDFEIDPDKLGLSAGEYSLSVKVQEGQGKPSLLLAGQENVRIPSAGGVAQVKGAGRVRAFVEISRFGLNPILKEVYHEFNIALSGLDTKYRFKYHQPQYCQCINHRF